MYVYIHIHVYACMYVHMYIHTYLYIYVYGYTYTYMYTHILYIFIGYYSLIQLHPSFNVFLFIMLNSDCLFFIFYSKLYKQMKLHNHLQTKHIIHITSMCVMLSSIP